MNNDNDMSKVIDGVFREIPNDDPSNSGKWSNLTADIWSVTISTAGIITILGTATSVLDKIYAKVKFAVKNRGVSRDEIEKQILEMHDEIHDLTIQVRDGAISEKAATNRIKMLYRQMSLLGKKAKRLEKSLHKESTSAALFDCLLEAKYATSQSEVDLARQQALQIIEEGVIMKLANKAADSKPGQAGFKAYYGALDKVSEKGARQLTPTADKVAAKNDRIANNTDYDNYYKRYSKTKKGIKIGTTAAAIATTSAIPLIGVEIVGPTFVAGAKHSPDPKDEKMVNDALDKLEAKAKELKTKCGIQKLQDIGVDAARVAANSIKAAIARGAAPDKKDIRTFDNAANKINAALKSSEPLPTAESGCAVDKIQLLLEGCIMDADVDSAIKTMGIAIEAYDFTNDEINTLFDLAETTIDLRLA